MNISDQKLITLIRAGDLEAFEELYRQYYVYLCLIAEHITGSPANAGQSNNMIACEDPNGFWQNAGY